MEAKELKLGLTEKKKKIIRGYEVREGRAAEGFKDFGKEEYLLHLPFPRLSLLVAWQSRESTPYKTLRGKIKWALLLIKRH